MSSRAFRFVVAESYSTPALDRLRAHGTVLELADASPEALKAALPEADALLVRAKTHVTARILEAAPRLKVIGRAGSNYDHIDLRVARQKHIEVVYAPHAAVRALVEYTVGLILATMRRLIYFDRHVREGEFETLRHQSCRQLSTSTLGLIGMDPVAQGVARVVSQAFGARVLFDDPVDEHSGDGPAERVALNTLLAEADVVSLHLPLTPATRGLLSAERLAMLKPTAIVVNVSRGSLIDTVALAERLKTHLLGGAGIDVYESEPLSAEHALRTAPNCILTPHVGSLTREAADGLFDVVEDVIRVLQGERPKHAVPAGA